jgi:NADPH:quinone reductase-like Zn-dependent oxidoreductase
MKAVILRAYGDVSQLSYETDEDIPEPGQGEVRVRVRATSINPVDYKLRSGEEKSRFPLDLPEILGVDLAGEVDALGPGVDAGSHGFPVWQPGQRVMAKANGTYAEYTVAKADALAPIPDALSFEQAAALPLVVLTGAQLIERAIKLQPSQTVLVTGALGSVGRTAVHVALTKGAKVIAGVRASQRAEAEQLGVERVVALDDKREMETVHDLDAVADTVAGPLQERILRTLKDGGVYGSVLGPPAHDPGRGIRVAAFMAEADASRLYELADEAARGLLKIPISKTFPLSEIQEATRLAEHHETEGKIILIP